VYEGVLRRERERERSDDDERALLAK